MKIIIKHLKKYWIYIAGGLGVLFGIAWAFIKVSLAMGEAKKAKLEKKDGEIKSKIDSFNAKLKEADENIASIKKENEKIKEKEKAKLEEIKKTSDDDLVANARKRRNS